MNKVSYSRINRVKAPKRSRLPVVAVRWLGAYGRAGDMESLVRSEFCARIEVACEVIQSGERSGITHTGVGLLVDQEYTRLVRCYSEDSWTVLNKNNGQLYAERNVCFVTEWNQVNGLTKTGSYLEGTIADPIYKAIVCRSGNRNRKFAEKLSKLTGLPVIPFEEKGEKDNHLGTNMSRHAKVVDEDGNKIPGQWTVKCTKDYNVIAWKKGCKPVVVYRTGDNNVFKYYADNDQGVGDPILDFEF